MNINRQTKKFLIDRKEVPRFHDSFNRISKIDEYARDGVYHVRSLYFDDDELHALEDRKAQKDKVKKFRIRLYNNDLDYIRLEEKEKVGQIGTKIGTTITQDQVKQIINGDIEWMKDSNEAVFEDFYYTSKNGLELTPKVVIAYTREPFTQEEAGTRLTLDYQILASKDIDGFLSKNLEFDHLIDDQAIIEVKWTGKDLPVKDKEIIKGLVPVNFSKYTSAEEYIKRAV